MFIKVEEMTKDFTPSLTGCKLLWNDEEMGTIEICTYEHIRIFVYDLKYVRLLGEHFRNNGIRNYYISGMKLSPCDYKRIIYSEAC